MLKFLKYFAIALIFTACGYLWAATAYKKEIKQLRADNQACEHQWVRDFSKAKGLIE